eukprot:TRINITY_DN16824_c0_g1_i1.p1 TRINITY_DN16824_c0_g1~~TRINITY_DN16824_c0_g1_i1.p1  ORF type:complete len:247 (+),score=77.32 TRINITY_DN16824_c0_g1_i1:32-742(+)
MGGRQIAERVSLNSMWEEAEAAEVAMHRAMNQTGTAQPEAVPGFLQTAGGYISGLPVFFWRTGRDRELGRGVQKSVRGGAVFLMQRIDRLADKGKLRPRVVRIGRRMAAEPMILSSWALGVPALVLMMKGRAFCSAMHTVALTSAALHHLDGETRSWLHMTHLCPLTFGIPATAATFLVTPLILQLVAVCGFAACVWLYFATGHPGTYSYEKYHLLWHWVWAATNMACAISVPYVR